MTPIHDDLLTILDAVEILSTARYTILGEPREISDEVTPSDRSNADPDGLVSALAGDVYERLYVRPSASPPPPRSDMLSRRDLVAALSEANTGQGTLESAWTIRRIDTDGERCSRQGGR